MKKKKKKKKKNKSPIFALLCVLFPKIFILPQRATCQDFAIFFTTMYRISKTENQQGEKYL